MMLALTACGGGKKPAAAPVPTTTTLPPTTLTPTTVAPTTTTAPAAPKYSVATAKVRSLEVYNSPVQPEPARALDNPQPSGASPGSTFPLRMLVVEERPDWLKVLLPIRPNGSSGWVRRSVVDLETHDYRAV